MSVINGTELTLYVPNNDASATADTWIAVALSKSSSLSISGENPDISTKSSEGWTEVIGGQKSWSIDFESMVDLSLTAEASGTAQTNTGILTLWTYFSQRAKLKVAWGQGGNFWYGFAYITSLDQSAEVEQPVSFSGNLVGSGVLALGTSNPPTFAAP